MVFKKCVVNGLWMIGTVNHKTSGADPETEFLTRSSPGRSTMYDANECGLIKDPLKEGNDDKYEHSGGRTVSELFGGEEMSATEYQWQGIASQCGLTIPTPA